MAPRREPLQELPPQPVSDEHTPLLADNENAADANPDSLEAQAEQERREHNVGSTPIADEPPPGKLLVILLSLYSCGFFAALDTTVVATLSGPISSSFNSATAFSWIASGYLVSNAAFQPLSGKLTDIYGRRAGLVFAVTFFAVGTLLCGLAQNAPMMILGRVIAGMGGGCINTVSVFITSDLVPLRKRGIFQGIANICYGAGMGLGGIYGGFINDTLGWRYAFYFQIPFIVLGGLLAFFVVKIPVKETDTAKIKRVDFLGAITLVASLVLFLLGLNSGGNTVPWNHPLVYVSIPLGVVLLAVFVYIEEKVAPEPIIPMHLLFHRTVAAASFTLWFQTMAMFSLIYYIPVYFQVVKSVSASDAGLFFLPYAGSLAVGSLGAGFVMRVTGKYRLLGVIMQLVVVAGVALTAGFFREDVAEPLPYIFMSMVGFGYGSILTVTLIAMISAVDHKWQAVVTSISYAFRSTGSTIGITVASTIFQNLLKDRLYSRFGDLPGAADEIRKIRDSVEYIKHLPASWHDGVISSYMEALRGVWIGALGFAVLAFCTTVFMRQHKLHNNLERK